MIVPNNKSTKTTTTTTGSSNVSETKDDETEKKDGGILDGIWNFAFLSSSDEKRMDSSSSPKPSTR
eukprot:CAMPEP_0116849220 /NCGR_PEP_ID=MMETSP0418-20121206/15444_1 /TAXON_ID=1158023 /ORGANISM="Astrosyne radiata, Strain 13vi08-1A" /LENGTH=65 /DNA_ID=CAMNT_0004480903 /DNA_START=25 /DNA_END=222 /DNA_ORIENTATION=-